MPQTEIIGAGSIRRLPDILREQNIRRLFLIAGRDSYALSGADQLMEPLLAGLHVIRFSNFKTNPDVDTANRALQSFVLGQAEAILAVGGGTAMDLAKLVAFGSAAGLSLEDALRARDRLDGVFPMTVCAPTTSGSGSQATKFAVFYRNHIKHSVEHDSMLPSVAIVDPRLTWSMPPYLTAATGMDALSQAIESYWSIHSSDESKDFARKAIEIMVANLETATLNPTPAARHEMAYAAHLSGKAINMTKTTACHAFSYPITSHYGVHHGHAVGLMLPSTFIHNSLVDSSSIVDPRGIDYVNRTMLELCRLLNTDNPVEAARYIQDLMGKVGLSTKLSDFGITSMEDMELIIKEGFTPNRVKNNPVAVSEAHLRKMLLSIL